MATETKKVEDKSSNPIVFAGLKFYDVLMEKQKRFSLLAHMGNLSQWRICLQDYYSSTASFMKDKDRTELKTMLDDATRNVNNFIHMQTKLGSQREHIFQKRHEELFEIQIKLMNATEQLNLKTSEGESEFFDAKKFFST